MDKPKVQSIRELGDEMRAIAREEKRLPKDAATPSDESLDVLTKMTTAKAHKVAKRSRPRSRYLEK